PAARGDTVAAPAPTQHPPPTSPPAPRDRATARSRDNTASPPAKRHHLPFPPCPVRHALAPAACTPAFPALRPPPSGLPTPPSLPVAAPPSPTARYHPTFSLPAPNRPAGFRRTHRA